MGLLIVPYEDSDEDSDDVVEVFGPITPSGSKKRRGKKLKEPLDVSFLRCSKRLNQDLGGYCDHASASAAALVHQVQPTYEAVAVEDADVPLHLSLATIQGMATGFLQLQPEAVAAAALLELDEDDD
jgi:hypothetical protein